MDLAGSERQKDTNAVGQRLKVSEMAIHILTCTCTFMNRNGSYFFYLSSQTNGKLFIRKNPK